jgi:hypothetical protein
VKSHGGDQILAWEIRCVRKMSLRQGEEVDRLKNLRKRRLTMTPRKEMNLESSLEEMIIERGIRDGSINWMVVVVMSS